MTSFNLPLAVSCGDPSGIGSDIILKTWQHSKSAEVPAFYVLGDPDQLAERATAMGIDIPIRATRPQDAIEGFKSALPVAPLENRFVEAAGTDDTRNAAGTIESIERAVDDVFAGQAAGIVTAPIAKKPLYDAGFPHPGHTEFLAELAERHTGKSATPVMMLAGPKLRAIPVTIHIPLTDVPKALTSELIVETAMVAHNDMKRRVGIQQPRLALSGLNPHAGEEGSMGREEIDIIVPAIEQLKKAGVEVLGPLPADTMFHDAARATYDVAICMYHDQALIPAKALGFDDAVNVTLGLPFIRTSPDHGTAFGIAGTGKAKPDSFIAALRMAHEMAQYGR